MTKREQLVEEARTWLGTPFHHQGRLKGVGCDCLGLITQSIKAIFGDCYDETTYTHIVDSPSFVRKLNSYFIKIPIGQAKSGDILLFLDSQEPTHLGIVTNKGFIHALAKSGRKVVEQELTDGWKKSIVAAYRIPGIDN